MKLTFWQSVALHSVAAKDAEQDMDMLIVQAARREGKATAFDSLQRMGLIASEGDAFRLTDAGRDVLNVCDRRTRK